MGSFVFPVGALLVLGIELIDRLSLFHPSLLVIRVYDTTVFT